MTDTNEYRTLKPMLTALCGGDEARAVEIIRVFPHPARVGAEEAGRICERLLSYPAKIDPKWFGDYWFLLFSCYADPCRILDELDKRFKPEHVMEVFTSREDWGQIGYGLNGGLLVTMKFNPRFADEALDEAEKAFEAYRL